jgi:hypothetical protein
MYFDRCLLKRLYGFTGRHLDRHLESDAQKQFQQKEALSIKLQRFFLLYNLFVVGVCSGKITRQRLFELQLIGLARSADFYYAIP